MAASGVIVGEASDRPVGRPTTFHRLSRWLLPRRVLSLAVPFAGGGLGCSPLGAPGAPGCPVVLPRQAMADPVSRLT